jgi:hypothetical protein
VKPSKLIEYSSIVFDYMLTTFENVDDVAIVCIYFNYKEHLAAREILGNVLKQLLERNSMLPEEIIRFYAAHCELDTPHATVREISGHLQIHCQQFSTIFIIIDALDECTMEENAGVKINSELYKLPNCRLLITGRPHVKRLISRFDSVISLEIRASDEDIRRSVGTQISESSLLLDCIQTDDEIRATITDTIVRKADGMYLVSHL